MRLVALDLSLTATGVVSANGPSVIKGYDQGMRRLHSIRQRIFQAVADADVVVIEGYSFGSGMRAHTLGELGGVVRLMLFDNEIPFAVVPPANLKQYACGKGNASKDDVFAAAIRRLDYPGRSKDEADALWLYAMAADHYGLLAKPVVPASHRAALQKVTWPVVGLEGSGSDGGKEAPDGSDDRGGVNNSEFDGVHPSGPSSLPDTTVAVP